MTETNVIRVMLVDDHWRIHSQITDLLQTTADIDLVAHASNGREAIDLCEEHALDIILMDVVMPDMDGEEATREIQARYPNIKILVLSSFQDDESVHAMLRSGASGYVTKRDLGTNLISSIRATYLDQAVFSKDVADQIISPDSESAAERFNLSERELEVLKSMADGLNNSEIAYHLTISRSTVNFHISNITRKLGVETRAEALVLAAKNRLV